jgi:hypothetical protein
MAEHVVLAPAAGRRRDGGFGKALNKAVDRHACERRRDGSSGLET